MDGIGAMHIEVEVLGLNHRKIYMHIICAEIYVSYDLSNPTILLSHNLHPFQYLRSNMWTWYARIHELIDTKAIDQHKCFSTDHWTMAPTPVLPIEWTICKRKNSTNLGKSMCSTSSLF